MTDTAPLRLFNSLTRQIETFAPITPGRVRVYSCGPTVYNYAHLGNLRAYVFTDTLRRTLMWTGYDVTHIIRSEEHTSELQSLLRISYAVFCFKKTHN